MTLLALVALAACSSPSGPALEPVPGAPNVVLILIDDMRWDALGATGSPFADTPNMDRLAAEGAVFENAFVVSSVCKPSRATMFSGLYPHAHRVTANTATWDRRKPNLFSRMKEWGYRVGYVGKWHLGGPVPPEWADRWVSFPGQGEYLDPELNVDGQQVRESGHLTDILTDHALRFLRAEAGGRFFLVLSHKAVHEPFIPQERWTGQFDAVPVAPPPSFGDDFDDRPAYLADRALEPDTADLIGRIRRYHELLAGADESVGAVRQVLEELGVLDNTLIILAGDNGYLLGEHRLWDKRLAYEESMRIPLLIRYPPWFGGGGLRPAAFALNLDIAPTIQHAVTGSVAAFVPGGFLLPPSETGRSLKEVADGTVDRSAFLYEYFLDPVFPVTPELHAIRTRDYLYVTYPGAGEPDELYDLRADPLERTNLAVRPDNALLVDSLRAELDALRAGGLAY